MTKGQILFLFWYTISKLGYWPLLPNRLLFLCSNTLSRKQKIGIHKITLNMCCILSHNPYQIDILLNDILYFLYSLICHWYKSFLILLKNLTSLTFYHFVEHKVAKKKEIEKRECAFCKSIF